MILVNNNVVAFIGTVEKGVYPEADGSRELYKITNAEGTFYAVTEGFTLVNVEAPSNVEPTKWCYTAEDGFYKNPNYRKSDAEIISDLNDTVDLLVIEMLGGK